jgi:hypothetical protein
MNKLIKISATHYIVVDDSEIKEEVYVYREKDGVIFLALYTDELSFADCKKITHSTQPLERYEGTEVLVFRKIKPLRLSEVAEDYWKDGFKQGTESKYSEEDMRECWNASSAYTIGSYKYFKQTHPDFKEWFEQFKKKV